MRRTDGGTVVRRRRRKNPPRPRVPTSAQILRRTAHTCFGHPARFDGNDGSRPPASATSTPTAVSSNGIRGGIGYGGGPHTWCCNRSATCDADWQSLWTRSSSCGVSLIRSPCTTAVSNDGQNDCKRVVACAHVRRNQL